MNNLNVQQNQGDNPEHDVSHVIMMPNIDENVPLPKNPKDAMPEMGMEKELQVRVETIKTIADLKGEPIPDANPKEQQKAVDFVKRVMTDPNFKPEYGNYPDPTMAFCAGMVAQTQVLLAKELADYKLYVVNNLIKVIESTENPKEKTNPERQYYKSDEYGTSKAPDPNSNFGYFSDDEQKYMDAYSAQEDFNNTLPQNLQDKLPYKKGGATKAKKFAALAPPYNKATFADRIVGAKKNKKK